ncbi:MAG: NAD(P)H-binding protein [Proteobacteria bacterium]|nr:NAD(P)H-binding protein [Pseudomonadota bacterium]
MRVAIFGGSGFVGSFLVDALIAAGHEPSLMVRPGSERKVRQAERCRLVAGNLSSTIAIDATLENCDAVIYNVGILKESPKQGITFEELQYNGVVRVAESAKTRDISRFLLMSANGAKSTGTPYQESKFRAEEHLRASGFDVTIFRPSVIFGDPRGRMEIGTQLYAEMISPPIPAVGFFTGWRPYRGAVAMSPVHVEDVAQAFLTALRELSTIGKTYVLGGPEVLSWAEMLRRIARTVGRKKWILPMPIGIMKLAAALLDWLPFFPVTRDQLTMLAEGNTADPAALAQLIGRQPKAFNEAHLAYLRN